MPGGTQEELATLCRSCGLCCDGSLFGLVPLTNDEVSTARRAGLRIVREPPRAAFEQTCSALAGADGARACRIYDARPAACRAFACRLYETHRREGGALDPRLAEVERARALLATVREDSDREVLDELAEILDRHFARA